MLENNWEKQSFVLVLAPLHKLIKFGYMLMRRLS